MTTRTAPTVADLLADPATAPLPPRTLTADRQHLAYGPLGIALLHIERAAAGLGPWQRAHDWLAAATAQPFTAGSDSHPFYGAPALAHVVACAVDHQPGRYQRTLAALDAQITKDAHACLNAAHRRIDIGELARLSEFDTIRGLTGYGAYLLRRDPSALIVRAVLEYLVRLVDPVHADGERLPGWWTSDGPSGRPDPLFPRGHANSGLAHGIGGVLALLALAARRGTVVHRHLDAMRTILTWLDRWREAGSPGISWPYWVTLPELRARRLARTAPRRPSWCYGTAGLARARQLAALALGDQVLQVEAEITLLAALTDQPQMTATTDAGLCHGFAGLAHVAARVAEDADPATAAHLRAAIPTVLERIGPPGLESPGFLDGAAGIALALSASRPYPAGMPACSSPEPIEGPHGPGPLAPAQRDLHGPRARPPRHRRTAQPRPGRGRGSRRGHRLVVHEQAAVAAALPGRAALAAGPERSERARRRRHGEVVAARPVRAGDHSLRRAPVDGLRPRPVPRGQPAPPHLPARPRSTRTQ